MAHLAHQVLVKGLAWAAASACCWEAWRMLRTVREQAEVLLATASETGNGVLITVGATAEDVLGAVRTTLTIWRTAVLEAVRLLEAAGGGAARVMVKCVHMSCMVVPMLVCLLYTSPSPRSPGSGPHGAPVGRGHARRFRRGSARPPLGAFA